MELSIETYAELQKMMEEYDLAEFASIPSLLIQFFQVCAQRDIESIILNIHQQILPDYYALSPWHLKQQLADQIQYPNIAVHKKYRSEWISVHVSTQPITAIFKQRLLALAAEGKMFKIPRSEIPESYQINPFVILSRIKKQHGINIKLAGRTATEYIYVIQP